MARDDFDDWLGKTRPTASPARAAKRGYEAFKPVDKRQLRVRICPRGQTWEWLPYAYLQRIVTDADSGQRLALIWGYAVAVIEGRNLEELDGALAQERVDAIRAFDPDRYDPPTDPAAPFIETITLHVRAMPDESEAPGEASGRH